MRKSKKKNNKKTETSKLQELKILDIYRNSKRILKSKDFDGSQKLKIEVKQLGKPLTGKFLSLVIKNEIVNSKHPE